MAVLAFMTTMFHITKKQGTSKVTLEGPQQFGKRKQITHQTKYVSLFQLEESLIMIILAKVY